jgi:hypothetical protein
MSVYNVWNENCLFRIASLESKCNFIPPDFIDNIFPLEEIYKEACL